LDAVLLSFIAAASLGVVLLLPIHGSVSRRRLLLDSLAALPRRRPNHATAVHVTVPGLDVSSDWLTVHDRLLEDFPELTDVLATTMPGALLIVYEGEPNIDGWVEE
jgi:hypothetical protein